MIKYEVEKVTDEFIGEITPILEVHRQELSKYSDMELCPAWDTYRKLEDHDLLVNLVARDEEGRIVGYACFFLIQNMHYSKYVYAQQDVFYVVPDKRGSRIAVNLVKKSEALLKGRASVIVHHAKLTNRFGEFLSKFGYNPAEMMFHKRID